MQGMNTNEKIPMTILTGFLGAGKTTLLNHIIHAEHGRRIAVLVNDFGAINIDSQLVLDVQEDMISLSNGCICCTIRGDFVAAVQQVITRPDKPDYIVVEASGVADPIDIGLTFKSMPQVIIDSILAVIDAEQIQTLNPEYAVLAMNQIGVADIVILNKVDLVSADELERVRQYIHKITQSARIFETSYADVPLELILNVGEYDVARLLQRPAQDIHVHETDDHHHHHHDHSQAFFTWNWTSYEPVSLKALERVLKQLPSNVYRAKGIFYCLDEPEHRVLAQVVGRRVTIQRERTWDSEALGSQFVLIAGHDGVDSHTLQTLMDSALAANTPKSGLLQLATGIISWLRP
jgi:G3E family GTPase